MKEYIWKVDLKRSFPINWPKNWLEISPKIGLKSIWLDPPPYRIYSYPPPRRELVSLRPNGLRSTSSLWGRKPKAKPSQEGRGSVRPDQPSPFHAAFVVVRAGRPDLLQIDVKNSCEFLTSCFHEGVGGPGRLRLFNFQI